MFHPRTGQTLSGRLPGYPPAGKAGASCEKTGKSDLAVLPTHADAAAVLLTYTLRDRKSDSVTALLDAVGFILAVKTLKKCHINP